MKRWLGAALIALAVVGWHAEAQACTTHTYWIDGKLRSCLTCCVGDACTTTCTS